MNGFYDGILVLPSDTHVYVFESEFENLNSNLYSNLKISKKKIFEFESDGYYHDSDIIRIRKT